MATEAEIAYVRRNAAEPSETTYTDEVLGDLIDANGVDSTVAIIWEEKAAKYSTATDVTEAGATHKFSTLFTNASAMAKYWRGKVDGDAEPELSARVKVRKIVRS